MMILPTPWPRRGVVIYAGRNSRQRGYAVFLKTPAGVRRVGYLVMPRGESGPPRVSWDRHRRYGLYSVTALAPWQMQRSTGEELPEKVVAARDLNREALNDLFAEASETRIGYAQREDAIDQHNVIQMMNDSQGMFRNVAQALSQPAARTVRFDNVHDDQAEDGLEEADTRSNFFAALDSITERGLDFFAYSGHGTYNGLPSAGIGFDRRGRERDGSVTRLCEYISERTRPDGLVLLYACSTADAGGFAEKLSRQLPGMTVIGHRTPARASVNPYKYRIRNGVSERFQDLLPQEVRCFWNATTLGRHIPPLYVRFPFLTLEQIATELRSEGQACS
jgi:hypothetical protein